MSDTDGLIARLLVWADDHEARTHVRSPTRSKTIGLLREAADALAAQEAASARMRMALTQIAETEFDADRAGAAHWREARILARATLVEAAT